LPFQPIKLAKSKWQVAYIVGEGTWNPALCDTLLVTVLIRKKYLEGKLEI
jgi:hypothetical protein